MTRASLILFVPALGCLALGCGAPAPDCPPAELVAATEAPGAPEVADERARADDAPEAETEPAPPTAGPDEHRWAELRFVDVPRALGPGCALESRIVAEPSGMNVVLVARGCETDVFEPSTVRLHLPDSVVAESPDLLGLRGLGSVPMKDARFDWQGNTFDEAWVEVDLGDAGRYWLEVPYGFVRDPAAPLPTSDARTTARLAPRMSTLGPRDHLVPFRHARYEVGEIQNGWRLAVIASNPFDAHVELELYREDVVIGESAYRWSLLEPRTDIEIVGHVGGLARSMQMESRLHEDGMRRSDHFTVFRRQDGRRGWGTIRATVGEDTYEVRVPSSLYLYTHGTADPYHAQRVVNAGQVLGGDLF
jgi:hypothetical protein